MSNEDRFEKVVSEALEKESSFDLPYDFADRVVLKIQKQAVEKDAKRDRVWLSLGIVSMIGALVFVFTQVPFKADVGVFTFFKGYSGLVIFGILFVVTLHIIDRRLFKKQESG